MSLRQQVHHLIDELPADSPLLAEIREIMRRNHLLDEALEETPKGRTNGAEELSANGHDPQSRKTSA